MVVTVVNERKVSYKDEITSLSAISDSIKGYSTSGPFMFTCNRHGYNCGIYASLDWLVNRILMNVLPEYIPVWCAQWGRSCDWPAAKMWQFTDSLKVGNRWFDGNWYLE